jgi:hypothetical protein
MISDDIESYHRCKVCPTAKDSGSVKCPGIRAFCGCATTPTLHYTKGSEPKSFGWHNGRRVTALAKSQVDAPVPFPFVSGVGRPPVKPFATNVR